jgi:hypothetical protein
MKAKLINSKRGFGGDSYEYLAEDGKTIVVSLGFGLMCPPEVLIRVGDARVDMYTTYDGWDDMVRQGIAAMKEAGYEPDQMPILKD